MRTRFINATLGPVITIYDLEDIPVQFQTYTAILDVPSFVLLAQLDKKTHFDYSEIVISASGNDIDGTLFKGQKIAFKNDVQFNFTSYLLNNFSLLVAEQKLPLIQGTISFYLKPITKTTVDKVTTTPTPESEVISQYFRGDITLLTFQMD